MSSPSPFLLMLGITGNLAFAAGALLLSFRRHSPSLGADVLVYTDCTLPEKDERLLRELGARVMPYTPDTTSLPADYLKRFSPLALSRLEAFNLLYFYETVVWLDVDTAIQGDISPLFTEYGPFSLALTDPHWYPDGKPGKARINIIQDIPRFNPHAPNYNSGVMTVTRALGDWHTLYKMCLGWLKHYGPSFRFADQGVLNMLAQHLQTTAPLLFTPLPHDVYNAHPRNPGAALAPLVHFFGPYNVWSDGRLLCAFPEWTRDYRRWLALGGSPHSGVVRHADFCPNGPLEMLGLAVAGGQAVSDACITRGASDDKDAKAD
ncbi:glycosyl transferase family 8 [Desulfovibrio sp. OttesenSCG-928-G15]|nr:glycosyl transferase family 8 [Desulfovibrio sp. OttesenSCG-928-G15]